MMMYFLVHHVYVVDDDFEEAVEEELEEEEEEEEEEEKKKEEAEVAESVTPGSPDIVQVVAGKKEEVPLGPPMAEERASESSHMETAPGLQPGAQELERDSSFHVSDPEEPEIKQLPIKSSISGRSGLPHEARGSREEVWQHSVPSRSPAEKRKRKSQDELALMVQDLQLQLREKEMELRQQRRRFEHEAREREEQVKKLSKDSQKLEREKWELLKRARDGAERSLNLQTQLDLKESQLRSAQTELERTRDELISVKSANTSLRALLSELRTPKPSKDMSVQVNLGGGTLRRNNSMELALQGLSAPQNSTFDRTIDFRASTTNLDRGAHHRISNCSAMSEGWPSRWERGQSVCSVSSSMFGYESRESTPTQSPVPGAREKKKRKKGPLFGKLRRSEGKRGSTPSLGRAVCTHVGVVGGVPIAGGCVCTLCYSPERLL